jgi:folate-dependent phosphoribosylglycinamide formyltransferase PurN
VRIALLTITSVASEGALCAFLRRRHRDVALVVRSNAFRGRRDKPIGKAWNLWRRSGGRYVVYIGVTIVAAPLLTEAPTGPDSCSLRALCRRFGIPVVRCSDVNGKEFRRTLDAHGVELLVSFFFDQILESETIGAALLGALNVHPSPLPFYRGPSPVLHMAADDAQDTAVTIHAITDRRIDAGPILAREAVAVAGNASILEREQRLFHAGSALLDRTLDRLAEARAESVDQGAGSYHSFPDRPTLARLRSRGIPLWRVADLLHKPR